MPKLDGPNATSWRTVHMKSWSSGSWNTMPTRRRISPRFGLATVNPPMSTVPLSGYVDAVEVQDEGGLARTVGAEHGYALASFDGELDAVECHMSVGVGERDVGDVNRWGVHGTIQAHTAIVVAATAGRRHTNHRALPSSSASNGIEPE